jgi:hypothetical protein
MLTPASSPEITVPDTIQPIHIPGPPRSRFAKHYLKLSGNDRRAERLDHCGMHFDVRDINKHKKRKYHHCMDGWCTNCPHLIGMMTYKRWKEAINAQESAICLTGLHATFTLVEFHIPHARRSINAIEAEFKTLGRKLDAQAHPRWDYTPGYQDNYAVLRTLYLGSDLTTEQWTTMFPGARVTVSLHSMSQLSFVFLDRLLCTDHLRSLDAHDRAEQSAMLGGMKRFRAHGIRTGNAAHGENDEHDIFAEVNILANMSFEDAQKLGDTIIPSVAPHRDICPDCGEAWIEQSQITYPGEPEPAENDKRWYPIQPRRPHIH